MDSNLSPNQLTSVSRLVAAIRGLLDVGSTHEVVGKLLRDDYSFEGAVDALEGLLERVQLARVGYPFVLNELAAQEINRLGSVLLGPVFTSDAYPWPVDDIGPMAPLCQLNSSEFPVPVEGIHGLVQIWLKSEGGADGEALIRLIPMDEVDVSRLTPIINYEDDIWVLLPDAVEWLRTFHRSFQPTKNQYVLTECIKKGYASREELAEADIDEFYRLVENYYDHFENETVPCWQISGFESGRIYCADTEDDKWTIKTLTKVQKSLTSDIEKDDELFALLSEVVDAFKHWRTHCCKNAYPCLLGNFLPIQYEVAWCPPPLVCFESVEGRDWGDGGNAQVFFSPEEGFGFKWSCT